MKDDPRIKQIQKLLDVAEGNLASARSLLLDILGEKKTGKVDHRESAKDLSVLDNGKVIEGVFNGEQMIAPDDKKYPVPANYASKSKLVEGDILKLTIAEDGSLIYKQINPIERKSVAGTLNYEGGEYFVLAEGKKYKVLFASVTYYKGKPGDKISVTVPKEHSSSWAALESILHEHKADKEHKSKEKKEDDVKFEIPKENKDILESVREKIFEDEEKRAENHLAASAQNENKEETEEAKENTNELPAPQAPESDMPKEKNIPKIKNERPPEDLEEETKEYANVSSSREDMATETNDDGFANQATSMQQGEDESFVKAEADTNALGEKVEGKDDNGGIQELEI